MQATKWIATLSVLLGVASSVEAQPKSQATLLAADDPFAIDHADPESKLPTVEESNRRPLQFGYLLMDLEESAVAARKAGDYERALKHHRALLKLVPERAMAYRAVCADYASLNRHDLAFAACRDALGHEGATVDDAAQLVLLAAKRPGGVDAKELEDARATIAHLAEQDATLTAALELECDLDVQIHDQTGLRECSKKLSARTPNSPRALAFAWRVAMDDRDYPRAREIVKQASKNTPAGAVDAMTSAIDAAEKGSESNTLHVGSSSLPSSWLLATGAVLLVLIALARRLTRAT